MLLRRSTGFVVIIRSAEKPSKVQIGRASVPAEVDVQSYEELAYLWTGYCLRRASIACVPTKTIRAAVLPPFLCTYSSDIVTNRDPFFEKATISNYLLPNEAQRPAGYLSTLGFLPQSRLYTSLKETADQTRDLPLKDRAVQS